MKTLFGKTPTGQDIWLYSISGGGITAQISDFGATIVKLLVPDAKGNIADVVLGYDTPEGYRDGTCFLGAVVGRNANRIQGSQFAIGNMCYSLTPNENGNNLHSGPACYHTRIWEMIREEESSVTFMLHSPNGDQGYPGNADITVRYTMDHIGGITITYDAVADQDTVFNLTNHSYFNLAGQERTDCAMNQILKIPARVFTPADAESIPTGEIRSVDGTPMDFRGGKAIGQDIDADYDALHLQGGFDHNYEVFCNPCATLTDPASGREMAVYTDLPGVQFYAGNFLNETGKNGLHYGKRSAICLETQYYPDAIHHPEWKQPVTPAGTHYHTETTYRFSW